MQTGTVNPVNTGVIPPASSRGRHAGRVVRLKDNLRPITLSQSSTADICIYCSSTSDALTREHVVPYSLGGNFVIQNASCRTCADVTSNLERSISRTTFHLPRAAFNMRSRRKNKFPSHVSVELSFGKFGPTKQVEVPIDRAAIQFPVPTFERMGEGFPVNAKSIISISSIPDSEKEAQERLRSVARSYNAIAYHFYSTPINPKHFARLLWKIATGFFFVACPASKASSQAAERALGRAACNSPTADGELDHYIDILSIDRDELDFHEEDGLVFTRAEEEHQNIWCAINLLPRLRLPVYLVRIDNTEGKEIKKRF